MEIEANPCPLGRARRKEVVLNQLPYSFLPDEAEEIRFDRARFRIGLDGCLEKLDERAGNAWSLEL